MNPKDPNDKIFLSVAPKTIGDLKNAIKDMDPSLTLFRIEFGNKKGLSVWWRKKTWKQWVKDQE
jgi:hypothetical protein